GALLALREGLHLEHPFRPELRLDHLHVGREAAEIGSEVRPSTRLGVEAVLLHVGENRAEPVALAARHEEARVHDDARDALLILFPENTPLVHVLGEPFLLADLIDPPEKLAERRWLFLE